MDAIGPIVTAWLAADERVHHKQRHTARRIHERLRDEPGFRGAESTVRAFVRGRRRASLRGVTIQLAHDPGAEAQVDFGEARVRIAGVETVVAGRSYRSNMVVVGECVFDRHQAAHAINLFDMDQKYADVVPVDEAVAYLRGESSEVNAEATG